MDILENERINNKRKVQINKKALQKKKRYRLIIGTISAVLVITSGSAIFKKHNQTKEDKLKQTVINYYGEDSQENKILQYLELSETLNDLKLENYLIDESLFSKYNILDELKSPEEIEDLIKQAKSTNYFISKKDIVKQSENCELVLNLIKQEKLVNDYIYKTGYYTANKDALMSTKKYTGEIFGIEDYENIKFKYSMDSVDATKNVIINYDGKDGEKSYSFDNFLKILSEETDKIMDGVVSINNTDSSIDKIDDNDEYNKARNEFIKNALEQSAILGYDVDNNDLYNERLSKKMK